LPRFPQIFPEFSPNQNCSFGLIQAVLKKTAGLHVALRGNISAPVQVTALVEVSKDAASLVVSTRKKIFWLGGASFLWMTS